LPRGSVESPARVRGGNETSGIPWCIGVGFLVDFGMNRKIGRAEGFGVFPRQSAKPGPKRADEHALVADGYGSLTLETHLAKPQLGAQANLVRRLQEPRAQRSVHFDEGTDNRLGPILKTSALPIFLSHILLSVAYASRVREKCADAPGQSRSPSPAPASATGCPCAERKGCRQDTRGRAPVDDHRPASAVLQGLERGPETWNVGRGTAP
jgi:hypothetical protein